MRERIIELLNDEIYDICDVFTPDEIAEELASVVDELNNGESTGEFSLGVYLFWVLNKQDGIVSCSNTEEGCTGVSRTLYFPFYEDDDDPDAGLKNLIEMVNEAWYACVN